MNKALLFPIFFAIILIGCSDNTDKRSRLSSTSPPAYDLSSPSKIYSLPSELNEISGIYYLGNNKVACIQDEKGIVYLYDLSSGNIEDKIKFGKDGDYEDLVKTNDGYFILRSDGTLYQYHKNELQSYSTPLKKSCNAEGLCYDSVKNQLLISCKNGDKQVWLFDLDKKKLADRPAFRVKQKGVHPTALAIEKSTGSYYILSNEQILILDSMGTILEVLELNPGVFPQAEGITFKDNGDLLISNEAKGSKATILEFKKRKNSL